MAIKFSSVGAWEKTYCFEDAITEKDTFNGTFGKVENGKFSPAADATKVIMQLEVGDDEYMDKYMIPAGSHVRVLDLEKLAENFDTIEIYGYPLPATVEKGNKLKSDASGALVIGGEKYEVTQILGNKAGVELKITVASEAV